MATEATTKPKQKETWLDWLVPGQLEPKPLITREELVDRVRQLGYRVNTGDLRYWEAEGILPQAVKRWHDGATRALYPEWMPYLVASLRDYQADGVPLNEIAERLRATFYRSGEKPGGASTRLISNVEQSVLAYGHEPVQPALLAYARRFQQRTGKKVSAVEVRLLDWEGELVDAHRLLLWRHEDEPGRGRMIPRESESG